MSPEFVEGSNHPPHVGRARAPNPVGLWQTNIEALLQQSLQDTSFLQRLQNRIVSFWYMATISHKKTVHLNRQTVRLTIIWKPHKSYKSIEP